MNPTPALKQAVRLIEFLLHEPNNENVRDLARDFVETMKSLEPPQPPSRSFNVASPRTAGAPPASPGPDFPEDVSERLQEPAKPSPTAGNLIGEHDRRGMTPYGYRWIKVGNRRSHLEPDPHEQGVLSKIQELRDLGRSYSQIVQELNRGGKTYAPRGATVWSVGALRLRIEQLNTAKQTDQLLPLPSTKI